jgi:hypothetical protein
MARRLGRAEESGNTTRFYGRPKEQPRACCGRETNSNTGLCIVGVQEALRRLSSPSPSVGEQAGGTDAEEDESRRFGPAAAGAISVEPPSHSTTPRPSAPRPRRARRASAGRRCWRLLPLLLFQPVLSRTAENR